MSSPTVLIIHAACFTPVLYDPFRDALAALDIESSVVDSPSVSNAINVKTMEEDVTAVRKAINALMDAGKDVVVVMHSYGGIPGSAAVRGLEKTGAKAGVIRLVYVASFALREGEAIPTKNDYESMKQFAEYDEKAHMIKMTKDAAMYAVFHDLSNPSEGEHWLPHLGKQSVGAMWSEQTYEAFRDIPSTYVLCNEDRVIPLEQQKDMIRIAQAIEPNAFDVVDALDCGHNPFLSRVEALAYAVAKAAGKD